MCYNMGEPWGGMGDHFKWKKPDQEDHILHDPIYVKGPEKAKLETKGKPLIAWG